MKLIIKSSNPLFPLTTQPPLQQQLLSTHLALPSDIHFYISKYHSLPLFFRYFLASSRVRLLMLHQTSHTNPHFSFQYSSMTVAK